MIPNWWNETALRRGTWRFCGKICHQRADRSFHYRGIQTPLCQRCFPFMISMVLMILFSPVIVFIIGKNFFMAGESFFIAFLFAVPLFVDVILQRNFMLISNWWRRALTGVLAAIGFTIAVIRLLVKL